MTTPRELITGALRLINVVQANESPTDADMDVSFSSLNNMLDSWSNEKLSIFQMNPYLYEFQAGKNTYTVGPEFDEDGNPTNADWVTERPMEILSLYVRYNNEYQCKQPPPPPVLSPLFTMHNLSNPPITYESEYISFMDEIPINPFEGELDFNLPDDTELVSDYAVNTNNPNCAIIGWDTVTFGLDPKYGEIVIGDPAVQSSILYVGIFYESSDVEFDPNVPYGGSLGAAYHSNGLVISDDPDVMFDTFEKGDIIGIIADSNNRIVNFFKNGIHQGTVNISSGRYLHLMQGKVIL